MPNRVTPLPKSETGSFSSQYTDRPSVENTPTLWSWVKKRWWAMALLALLLAGIIVAIIVGPVCAIRGCPPKQYRAQDPGPPRLIVAFNLEGIDVLDVIPAVLHPYLTSIKLQLTRLQIVAFYNEEVLQEAQTYLKGHPNLDILVRDFVVKSGPGTSSLPGTITTSGSLGSTINNILANLGLTERRRLQQSSSTADARTDTGAGSKSGNSTTSTSPVGPFGVPAGNAGVGAVPVNDPYVLNGLQWHHERIHSQRAWATTPANDGEIVVAVIDKGFDLNHPDIKDRLWVNKVELLGPDADRNGKVGDIHGWDFAGGPCDENLDTCTCTQRPLPAVPSNENHGAHGTHVMGIIGAAANNSQGGVGGAPNVKLMLLAVAECKEKYNIFASSVFQALSYAAEKGAHIVSMSLGADFAVNQRFPGPPSSIDQTWSALIKSYTEAMRPLYEKNALVVAAAGNENIDVDNVVDLGYTYVPCVTPYDNVLCVGVSDMDDNRAGLSNFGKKQVDIFAPGVNILSTYYDYNTQQHTYMLSSGTSMATPVVSGVGALVASVLGSRDRNFYKGRQARSLILKSGDIIPSLKEFCSSGMRVNAYNAVKMALQSLTFNLTPPALSPWLPADAELGPVTISGAFHQTYWTNFNPLLLETEGHAKVDETLHSDGPQFTSIKYNFTQSVMFNASALLQVNTSGLHAFTIRYPTQYYPGGRIVVNGKDLGLIVAGTNGSRGIFNATAPGWYHVALFLVPVDPALGSIDVLLTPPRGQPDLYASSYTLVANKLPNSFAVNTITSLAELDTPAYTRGWNVNWNKTEETFNRSALSIFKRRNFSAQSPYWKFSGHINSLPLSSSSTPKFMELFELPDAQRPSVVGAMNAVWNSTAVPPKVHFNVNCNGCKLYVNDILVVDNWQSMADASPRVVKGGCVTIVPGAPYDVSLAFVASSLDKTSGMLQIFWSDCDNTSNRTGRLNVFALLAMN